MLYIISNGIWKGDYVMFSHFFGNYLIRNHKITKQQLHEIQLLQKTDRVKFGILAVASQMLTFDQADEINRIQSTKDKRFGDIAIEKGYLTQEQVDFLVQQQGSPYMAFTQAALSSECLSLEDINQMLTSFQSEYSLTDEVLDAMKEGNIEAFTQRFIHIDQPLFFQHFSLFLRNIIRFIQRDIYFESPYCVDTYEFEFLASQSLTGTHSFFVGLSGKGKALLEIANPYADENFQDIDEDVFDAVCEFINCVNGLYARTLYEQSIEEDMLPPLFYTDQTMLSNGTFFVLPVYINNQRIDIVIAIDQDISFR